MICQENDDMRNESSSSLDLNDVPTCDGWGINVVLSDTFLNTFIRKLFPQILDVINDQIGIEGKTISFKVKELFDIHFTIDGFNITDIKYDERKTQVNLDEYKNEVGIQITNSSVHFNLTYKVELDPNIISDKGVMLFGFDQLSLDLRFIMLPLESDIKKLQIKVVKNKFTLDPANTYMNLTNENDYGNSLFKSLEFFKQPITQLITTTFEEYLELAANRLITAIPYPIEIDNVVLDSSLIHYPIIKVDKSTDNGPQSGKQLYKLIFLIF